MSGLKGFFAQGRDRKLAAEKYAGRKSASEKAAHQRSENHRKGIAKAAAAAEEWEARDRRRTRVGAHWYRSRLPR